MIRHDVFQRVCRSTQCLLALAASLTAGIGTARAQDATPALQPFRTAPAGTEPTVRRALPVEGDSALPTGAPPTARAVPVNPVPAPVPENPAWINRVPPAGPASSTPRAKANYPKPGSDAPYDPTPAPEAAESPAATPAPKGPRIKPHNPPVTTNDEADPSRQAAAQQPPAGGNEDDPTDIRIAPGAPGVPTASPEETQFNLANDFYDRKQFAPAAAEYERYLGQFPEGKHRQAALWWVGESYRLLKRTAAARSSYSNLVIAYQEGEFVGPAALRLASIDYEDKDYATALPLFRKSSSLAKNDEVRLISRYYEAICLEQLDRRDETREVYESILTVTKDNPYRDESRVALATMAVNDKRYNEAFKQYEALSREATKPGLQADASYKAGMLARELGQNDTAAVLYARAIGLPGSSAGVRADAMLAQMHLFYDTNKYKQLLEGYPGMKPAIPAAQQPEAMLLAANSERQLGKHAEAREIYDDILRQFPRTPQAADARYQRIISLYATNDPNFVKEADDFILSSPEAVKIDQVRLMKADTLFKKADYDGAALAYGVIDASNNLPPKYKAEVAYRLGYCYGQARPPQPEKTVMAFRKFLDSYPEHPFVTKALIQRAVAYEQLKKYDQALTDFSEVITDHKDTKEREMALQQKAFILGQQGDTKGMADTCRILLKDYPKTEAAGLAHYFIATALYDPAKDYEGAAKEFEAARKNNPKEYGARASLMLIRCEYALNKDASAKDIKKLATEVDAYQKAKSQPGVPPSILGWLGEQEYDAKEYDAAERYLTTSTEAAGDKPPETWLMLARARLTLNKYDGALDASQKFLAGSSPEPATRTAGLLAQGEAQLGLKKYDDAQKSVDESLQLQPEGVLNAKARMLGGKIAYDQGKYEAAAKSYMSVSVLYDDSEITPAALKQAVEAFEKAGHSADAKKASEELKSRFPNYAAAKVP